MRNRDRPAPRGRLLVRFLIPVILGFILIGVLSRHTFSDPTIEGLVYITLALVALLLLSGFTFRNLGGINPLRVYLALAVTLFLIGWCIYVLSFLSPLFLFAIVALLGVLVAALTMLRNPNLPQEREDAGLCPKCGYDLRATPDRCPECNTPVPHSILRRRRAAERLAHDRQAGAMLDPGAMDARGDDDPSKQGKTGEGDSGTAADEAGG